MAVNFIYQSKSEEERIQNSTKIFEDLVNQKLRNSGSKYQIKYEEKTTM